MATKNRFSHTDSLGRTFGIRLNAFSYGFPTYRGENIAAGYASGTATFEQWRASAGHNTNMLNPNYTGDRHRPRVLARLDVQELLDDGLRRLRGPHDPR